jgi:predicted HTH domain antitoxin
MLAPSGSDLGERVREAVVWDLFLRAEVSAGRAAELLGISKEAFQDLVRQRGIPYFRQTPEELDEEIRNAAAMREQTRR